MDFVLFISFEKNINNTMKKLMSMLLLSASLGAFAQVKVTNGPELENDRDSKMNRMLGGDDNSFYCYRIKTKGKGTSFFVEKYNKKSLKADFSKEITVEDAQGTKIEDVEYAMDNVFIFRREYDKKAGEMNLYYQTVSSQGKVSNKLVNIVSVISDHYEFVDFDVVANPSKTKFLVKACSKPNKAGAYKTDFILFEAPSMKAIWTKTVKERLSNSINIWASMFGAWVDDQLPLFNGMFLDDADNLFYCYSERIKSANKREKFYELKVGSFASTSNKLTDVTLKFDDNYLVSDIEFSLTPKGELVVGGFLKDIIERKGRDLVKVGIFSFTVDKESMKVMSNAIKLFDDKILAALESTNKKSRYLNYKLDYIKPVGDAVYYIGEQYSLTERIVRGNYGMTTTYYDYEYQDVIVCKLNAKGEFEWIKNAPLRNSVTLTNFTHVFKQYIAFTTDKNIYILCDEHPKNMERYEKPDFEPKDLKTVSGIHGSNFVCTTISLDKGNIKHQMLFENKDYCFAPIQERNPQFMPPEDVEIFVPSKDNELFIYTEDRGRDRFSKIKFD